MQGSCKAVSNLSRSGDRQMSKSRREYHPIHHFVRKKCRFLLSHAGSTYHSSFGMCVKIWTDGLTLTFFKGIPRTESITPCVRLYLSFYARRHDAHARSLHLFQGTSSPPPSNVRIESSVSERWEMAASGSVAWTASPNKGNASYTHSVRPSTPLRAASG